MASFGLPQEWEPQDSWNSYMMGSRFHKPVVQQAGSRSLQSLKAWAQNLSPYQFYYILLGNYLELIYVQGEGKLIPSCNGENERVGREETDDGYLEDQLP